MLFHDYLETLLGSRVKIKVLRVLRRHSGKEFTVRELSDFLGLSHAGVRKALVDLDKMNVIRIRVIGRSHAIALNVESYAAELVDNLFRMEEETLSELVKHVGRALGGAAIASAQIFGSIARGEEVPLSDIDLFIIAEDKEKAEAAVSRLQSSVSGRFGNAISPYIFTSTDLVDEKKRPILEEISKKHVLVYGEP